MASVRSSLRSRWTSAAVHRRARAPADFQRAGAGRSLPGVRALRSRVKFRCWGRPDDPRRNIQGRAACACCGVDPYLRISIGTSWPRSPSSKSRNARWCVSPNLHHHGVFAPRTAGVDVKRPSRIPAASVGEAKRKTALRATKPTLRATISSLPDLHTDGRAA
jgi:hypothetical protein